MRFFGKHPKLVSFIKSKEKKRKFVMPELAKLEEFFCEKHPEVYLIPRDRYITVFDQWDDAIGFFEFNVPFSSFNFYQDFDFSGGVFNELYHTDAFWRLGDINQLGYLHSPKSADCPDSVKIHYLPHQFPHTRWGHSLFTAMLSYVILARNGFSLEEIKPFTLAAACHDIATPAGGDSVMRIDREKLSEETNFSRVLRESGLDRKWKKDFGFNLEDAQKWIGGRGAWGKLLDIVDKISYTALDAYYVAWASDNPVRRFCIRHPLVLDIWQDVRFNGREVWFASAKRLCQFLTLRALNHTELYLNPCSRSLDHTLSEKVGKRYRRGEVADSELLTWGDQKLENWLLEKGEVDNYLISPDDFEWRRFETEKEARLFADHELGRLSHIEKIKPFKTGLDWLVKSGRRLALLRHVLPRLEVLRLEQMAEKHAGWYVYLVKNE